MGEEVLGTAVDYLVRQSPAPVLVVKRRPQKAYKRLLVATDFSDCSIQALNAAADLFPDASLRVVHSYQTAWEAFLSSETTVPIIRDECQKSMEHLVEALPERVRGRVETVLDEGHLGSVIEEMTAWNADLLVLGSHGRSGFAHATIGDTAAALLQSAASDVLLVRRAGQLLSAVPAHRQLKRRPEAKARAPKRSRALWRL